MSVLNDPFQIVRESYPPVPKTVEILGDEDGTPRIFAQIVWLVVEWRRQARPFGPALVVDVVAALLDCSSMQFRLFGFEPRSMEILIHTQSVGNAHCINKLIAIRFWRNADEPVTLLKFGSRMARST